MGYASLEGRLPSSHTPFLPPGVHLSITDTQASDGSFLLHHFISNYVKGDQRVVVVGLAGIMAHYTMVGRKLGVNLGTARTKGVFHYIDGITHLTNYATPMDEYISIIPEATANVAIHYKNSLSEMYITIRDLIQSIVNMSAATAQPRQLCVILDDLSVLINSGWSCRDTLGLVKYLKLLLTKCNGSLVTLAHADAALADELDQDGLIKGLFYEAEYIIDVKGLGSGGSRDVHGQLSFVRGPRLLSRLRMGQIKDHEWPAVTLHYRVLDNNVEIFAKGFSSGVL